MSFLATTANSRIRKNHDAAPLDGNLVAPTVRANTESKSTNRYVENPAIWTHQSVHQHYNSKAEQNTQIGSVKQPHSFTSLENGLAGDGIRTHKVYRGL